MYTHMMFRQKQCSGTVFFNKMEIADGFQRVENALKHREDKPVNFKGNNSV